MITLLENSQTRKKHTMNFVDSRGKVLGFNPYPNNKIIKYELRNQRGILLFNEQYIPIDKYLIGSTYHFGNDISFSVANDSNELSAVNIELVSDDLRLADQNVLELRIEGIGGQYYCEDIGLSERDKRRMFTPEAIERAKEKRKDYVSTTIIENNTDPFHKPDYTYHIDKKYTYEELNAKVKELEVDVRILKDWFNEYVFKYPKDIDPKDIM